MMVTEEEKFPLVQFHKKSGITCVVLENSYIDGLPAVDVNKLDGDYVLGIHKKLYDFFSPQWDMEIQNMTIKMKRR